MASFQQMLTLICGITCLVSCRDTTPETAYRDSRIVSPSDSLADRGPGGERKILDQAGSQDYGRAGLRFAALADLHADGDYSNIQALVTAFNAAGVDFFVVLGDTPLNGALRGIEERTEDELEIISALEIIAKSNLPVYVLAGNHETRQVYARALGEVQARYPNIIDLAPLQVFEQRGLVFAALSGAHNAGVVPAVDGFLYGVAEIENLAQQLAQHEGASVLLTHDPPLTAGAEGIDFVEGYGNVGDPALSTLIDVQGIDFSLSGHIHQASPRAVNDQNSPVAEGIWSEKLYLNVGAAVNGVASLVVFEQGKMMFTSVVVP